MSPIIIATAVFACLDEIQNNIWQDCIRTIITKSLIIKCNFNRKKYNLYFLRNNNITHTYCYFIIIYCYFCSNNSGVNMNFVENIGYDFAKQYTYSDGCFRIRIDKIVINNMIS